MYRFLRYVARFLTLGLLQWKFRTEGRELVPRRGGLLVCANHIGSVDVALVPGWLPRADSWSMSKSEWFERGGRFTLFIFNSYHAFPVIRNTADRRALRHSFDILSGGASLVIYPDGTRIGVGGLTAGEQGAGYLALRSQAAIQPVGLIGTRECMPKGAHLPRRVPVIMRFGAPVRIHQHHPDGSRVTNAEATAIIMLAIARLLPPELRGAYSDLEAWEAKVAGLYSPA
jgi:1-acyl-sn-glycerol-3-phosphate acyltransferase